MRRLYGARGVFLLLGGWVTACSLLVDRDDYTTASPSTTEGPNMPSQQEAGDVPDASADTVPGPLPTADGGQPRSSGATSGVGDDAAVSQATDCSLPEVNCEGALVCDEQSGECVECLQDEQCEGRQGLVACRGDQQRCVECTDDGHCNGNADGPVCDSANNRCVQCLQDSDCGGNTPLCDTGSNQCVQCLNNAQCTDPAASRCDTGTSVCVGCQGNADCQGIIASNANGLRNLAVCDLSGPGGECVECTGNEFSTCGGFACDSTARTCSSSFLGSASRCDECISDAHCGPNLACREETFGGASLGPKCFPLPENGICAESPFSLAATGPSLDSSSVTVCVLRDTTCQADEDFTVSCTADEDCGEPGVDDGLCRFLGIGLQQCTYRCTTDNDCPSALISCNNGECIF